MLESLETFSIKLRPLLRQVLLFLRGDLNYLLDLCFLSLFPSGVILPRAGLRGQQPKQRPPSPSHLL